MYKSSVWAAIVLTLGPGSCFRGAFDGSSDTYAIVLSASRFWFNYRHTSGALAVYDTLRRLGLPDDRILLYLSEDHAWDSRNPYRGAVFGQDGDRHWDSYPQDVEVDCAGASVTPESFLRAVTGRHSPAGPSGCATTFSPPPRGSTLLLYMTGHGGEGFLKFHDKEELTYADLGHALHDSWLRGLFSRVLVISDTCQAGSLGGWIHSPGVLLIASSVTGQNSYATGRDEEIGLSLSDGFTRVLSDNLRAGWALEAGQQGQGQGGMAWSLQQTAVGQRARRGKVPTLLHTLCKANRTDTRASSRMQHACQYLHRSLSGQDREGSRTRWPPLHQSFYVPVAHALARRSSSTGSRPPPWSLPLRTLTMPDWRITSTVTWETSWAWPLDGRRQGAEREAGLVALEEEQLLQYWGYAQEVHAHD